MNGDYFHGKLCLGQAEQDFTPCLHFARKEGNMKLQVLVNKVLRSLTGMECYTSVYVQLSVSGKLFVQQCTAFFLINSVHRSMQSQESLYTYSALKPNTFQAEVPHHQSNCKIVRRDLSISRCEYSYRGSRLYNLLPAKSKLNML